MSKISIYTELELSTLASMVADSVRNHEEIKEFILELDLLIADYDFTVELRDELNKAIAAEDAVIAILEKG